ncbi:hypothetical protein lerEdw1_008222 [Lerista edwardsae]|nr:hypothetical protein lerEdw1_008222 [Lerista edwardsae]
MRSGLRVGSGAELHPPDHLYSVVVVCVPPPLPNTASPHGDELFPYAFWQFWWHDHEFSLYAFRLFWRHVNSGEPCAEPVLFLSFKKKMSDALFWQNMDFRDPFSAMDKMMSNMRNNMLEMQRSFDKISMDPNAHSFSSSSVMTYSKKGDEPPKVFQASAQTRTGPGGIKETRKALKDSESGLEKMAIGHHIQDRAHIIQKAKNNKTGDEELNQEFFNLDESDAHAFDEEWQKEILRIGPSGARNKIEAPRHRRVHRVDKEDATRRYSTCYCARWHIHFYYSLVISGRNPAQEPPLRDPGDLNLLWRSSTLRDHTFLSRTAKNKCCVLHIQLPVFGGGRTTMILDQ